MDIGLFSQVISNKTTEMASSYIRCGLGWTSAKMPLLKWLSNTGTGCPGKWWNHHPWRYLKTMSMRHLWRWFSGGLGSAGLTFKLYLRGPFLSEGGDHSIQPGGQCPLALTWNIQLIFRIFTPIGYFSAAVVSRHETTATVQRKIYPSHWTLQRRDQDCHLWREKHQHQ